MHSALQEREHILMGDPDAIRELIPQVVWAITAASRDFYGTIMTREDIDPTEEHVAPTVAVANLSLHTTMFKAGIRLNLTNVPTQWKWTPSKSGGSQQAESTSGKAAGQTRKRHGSDPFRPTNTMDQPAQGTNPNHPEAFRDSELLKRVKEKYGQKTSLTAIAQLAGLANVQGLTAPGLDAKTCLTWVCLGACHRRHCWLLHPATIDDAVATALYTKLELGLKKALEVDKLPWQKDK
jgi:hypothetical protein